MIRENVLKIEHRKVFDKYAVRIVYQNYDVLVRENFNDCGIKSISHIEYRDNVFYVRGSNIKKDNEVIIVDYNQLQDIFEKVNKVNLKYGIVERWRASDGEDYCTILSNGEIFRIREKGSKEDNARYELGNYFQSIVEAKKVMNSVQWKTLWDDVKEDRLQFGE